MENSSAFYRKATYHRAAHGSTAPSPLVLKELPIIPFEGDVRQFPRFRNRFLDVVEAHPNLAPRHKLQAARSANNYQITDTNYYTVLDLLQEQYGDEDAIRNLLLKNLVQLRSPSSATADIRRFHDEAFRITNELKQLGDDVDGNRLYEQTLISKLSSALKIELIRHSDYAAKKTVTSILDGLRKYTQIMRLTASTGIDWSLASGLAGPPGQTGPRRAPSPYRPRQRSGSRERNPSYGKSSPRQRPGGYKCAPSAPSSTRPQLQLLSFYTTVFMRLRRVRMLRLCHLCLGEGHRTAPCPRSAMDDCTRCKGGQHHETLCPKAEVASPDVLRRRRTVSPLRPTATANSESCRQARSLIEEDAERSAEDKEGADRLQAPENPRSLWSGISVRQAEASDARASDASTAHGSLSPDIETGPTRCDKAIPKKIQGQTWKEEPRTAPKGRQGTTLPTTTDACKSLSQQQTDAFGNDDLLARRTLWTDRSSPTTHRLRTPEQDRQVRGFRTELRSRTNGYGSQEAEEGAVNPTRQRRSRTEQDNVNRFDKTKAVQYRSGSSSGGSDESEGSAS
ncbi:Pao retrotransposon peptidase family protein-like protein, partial [Aphelenchoides avenae]